VVIVFLPYDRGAALLQRTGWSWPAKGQQLML
jgi:hypothetical protein